MPKDVATVRSRKLLAYLELEDIDFILRERCLNWFSHVEHSSGAFRIACAIQFDGRRGWELYVQQSLPKKGTHGDQV